MVNILDFVLHIDKYLGMIISNYGVLVYAFLFLIIFIETGLVIMPFLPGDSLLFIAGTLASAGFMNVFVLFLILGVAAILGDSINYFIGNYFGEKVFSRFINQENLEKTKSFYKRHGGKTIILARFVPIIRTIAPFVAGVGKMNYSRFLRFNVVGGVGWVGLFVFAGYFFGSIPLVKNNLSLVIILIIVVSLIPAVVEYIRNKK